MVLVVEVRRVYYLRDKSLARKRTEMLWEYQRQNVSEAIRQVTVRGDTHDYWDVVRAREEGGWGEAVLAVVVVILEP